MDIIVKTNIDTLSGDSMGRPVQSFYSFSYCNYFAHQK